MAENKTPEFNLAAEKPSPETVLREALDYIESASIQNSGDKAPIQWAHTPPEKIDWKKLRETALDELRSVENPTVIDISGVVDRAVRRLQDRHSLITHKDYRRTIHAEDVEKISWPEQKQKLENLVRNNGFRHYPPQPLPTAEYIGQGDVLHVTVPHFSFDAPGANRKAYQDVLINALKEAAGKNVKGVIVDLRENSGGAMTPMISGLSPLLGAGTLGYFRNPQENYPRTINYGPPGWEIADDPANFPLLDTPVAVLAGPNTSSSGEITYLSFSGRPHTRSFGEPTDGNSSGNASYTLKSDKDLSLHITASIALDRNGKGDGGPLKPDVITKNPLEEALSWIESGAPEPKQGTKPLPQPKR